MTASFLNVDNGKSYATEENLEKAIARAGLGDERHMNVRNREGRWTTLFFLSHMSREAQVGAIPRVTTAGFFIFN